MAIASTVVTTEHASRYLQQLCKHWSHKFAVSFDAAHGTVELPSALLTLDAEPTSLALMLNGPDQADVSRLCDVVEKHVVRFAFREPLQFDWTGQG